MRQCSRKMFELSDGSATQYAEPKFVLAHIRLRVFANCQPSRVCQLVHGRRIVDSHRPHIQASSSILSTPRQSPERQLAAAYLSSRLRPPYERRERPASCSWSKPNRYSESFPALAWSQPSSSRPLE